MKFKALLILLVGICFWNSAASAWLFWNDGNAKPEQSLAGKEPCISVGLANEKKDVTVSADAPFCLLDPNQRRLADFPALTAVTFTNVNGAIVVNGKICPDGSRIVLQPIDDNKSLIYNKRKYRGDFIVMLSGAKKNNLTLVNTLPVEQYLYSVVGTEISSAWPQECLKAQAIAARSYADYSLNGKRKYQLFDVLPDTSDQGYTGRSGEDQKTRQAVDSTRGIVAMYNGKVAKTLFMAGAGGMTASAAEVWGVDYPYLQSVDDYDEKSPCYNWTVRIKTADFSERIEKAGFKCGNVQEVLLSPLPKGETGSGYCGDRSASGRALVIVVIGDKDTVEISGVEMRKIFGLKSTLFEITLDKDEFVFNGRGWGHGVGLSQYGAKQMAESKSTGGMQMTSQQILTHYFTGIKLEKIY